MKQCVRSTSDFRLDCPWASAVAVIRLFSHRRFPDPMRQQRARDIQNCNGRSTWDWIGTPVLGTLLRVRRGCGRSLLPARTSLVAEASIRKHEEPSKLSIGKRDNDEEWHVHVVPPLADSKVVLCPCASSLMPLNLPHIPDFPSMRKQEARDIHRRQRRIDMALIGTPVDVGYALLGTRRWACSHIVRGGGMQTKNESHASMRRKRRNFR
mmetsp:Transcript_50357/g.118505  ORF Transcript_50357/g.118505 Transcript_50357/m.118505 type:complete len:210 (-) Transcript_50357:201-830(-)